MSAQLGRAFLALVFLVSVVSLPSGAEASWWRSFRPQPKPDVIEVMERDGHFKTLLSLLDITELTGVLEDGGPFTIYAPTDAAFDELLGSLTPDQITALLSDTDTLSAILLNHVSSGKLGATRLVLQSVVPTLGASPVLALLEDRHVLIQSSKVVKANLRASNGIVHGIDRVLEFPEAVEAVNNALDALRLDGRARFTTLLSVLEATGLDIALGHIGPFTLFAPTNEAFAEIAEIVGGLTADQVAEVLKYHVVLDKKRAFELILRRHVNTLADQEVRVRYRRGHVRINDADVVNPNVRAPGAIVHVIDEVLIPDLSGSD